jgi:hypothetical protein
LVLDHLKVNQLVLRDDDPLQALKLGEVVAVWLPRVRVHIGSVVRLRQLIFDI